MLRRSFSLFCLGDSEKIAREKIFFFRFLIDGPRKKNCSLSDLDALSQRDKMSVTKRAVAGDSDSVIKKVITGPMMG